jgi:hypothetical protein
LLLLPGEFGRLPNLLFVEELLVAETVYYDRRMGAPGPNHVPPHLRAHLVLPFDADHQAKLVRRLKIGLRRKPSVEPKPVEPELLQHRQLLHIGRPIERRSAGFGEVAVLAMSTQVERFPIELQRPAVRHEAAKPEILADFVHDPALCQQRHREFVHLGIPVGPREQAG